MKSKKSLYILLPIVIGIWAMVIYQFISFGHAEVQLMQMQQVKPLQDLTIQKQDKDPIVVDYRDPFLGKIYSKKKKKGYKTKTVKPPVVWPQIKYKGLVSSGKNTIYMVMINNKDEILKLGNSKEDVVLKKASKKSITVQYKGEHKEFLFQQ